MAFQVDWEKLQRESDDEKNRVFFVVSGDKEFKENMHLFLPVGDVIGAVSAKEVLVKACDTLLKKQIEMGRKITVVTSDNVGTDKLALEYSVSKDYDCLIVNTDWDGMGRRAGYYKNEEIMYQAGRRPHKCGLLMWNGEDVLTRNMIYQAYCMGVPLRVYNYHDKRWLKVQEIEDIQSEERRKASEWRNKVNEQNV